MQGAEPTDLNMLMRDVLAELAGAIDRSKATVDCARLPTLSVSRSEIARLFMNLIDSTLKYKSDKPPHIKITVSPYEQEWTFAVRSSPGTALVSGPCKKIIEKHGGRSWIHSHAGRSATFYFTLPMN